MNMTKTPIVLALAATLAVAATGISALAQRPGGGGPPGGGGGFGGGRGGGMRMYESLGLKPEQKTKIEAMVKKHREAQQALRKKQTDEIMKVLTPEQRKKLEAQMAEMRQRFGGGMMGGPGGGGPRRRTTRWRRPGSRSLTRTHSLCGIFHETRPLFLCRMTRWSEGGRLFLPSAKNHRKT